jgi:hypothetical protein
VEMKKVKGDGKKKETKKLEKRVRWRCSNRS